VTSGAGAPVAWASRAAECAPLLGEACAVGLRAFFAPELCARWVAGVYAARAAWTAGFGGEQFSLGCAFYTHLEEGRSPEYFASAGASDAEVEAHAPGLQAAMRALVAAITGATAIPRRGWCGPGVHVFPAGGHVARSGGVVHFDTEGLAGRHIAQRRRAITAVAMLQPAESGGGLRVWDARYAGRDGATRAELRRPSAIVPYAVGDVVVIDSYRLHQIQPFGGARDRVSATVHAAEIDVGLWETWF
jgi:hypothetical protein